MAKIVAVAGVRLTVDGKGLAAEMKGVIATSLREASKNVNADTTKPIRDDVDRTSKHVRDVLRKTLGTLGSIGSGFTRVLGSGLKLALIGTAAAGALAGVTSLAAGVFSLAQSLVAASGVAALLPAALAGLKAVTATVKIGLVGIDDAMKALGEDTATFEEKIKDLAPNAQKFMRTMRELKPAFDGLRMGVQNRLFLGLSEQLKTLTGRYLPLANRLFVTMAGSINNAARDLGDFLAEGRTVNQVGGIVENLRLSFAQLAPALTPVVQALLDITDVGSSFLPQLTSGIAGAAEQFAAFIREAAQTGQLQAFIQNAIDTLKQLGRIIANVFATFGNVMDAANSQGVGLLNTIERITGAMRDWTASARGQEALSSFFESMHRVIEALMPAVMTLVEVFARDLAPILADIAEAIGPVLGPLFESFGRLLRALRPLIQALAQVFAVMLKALGPVIDAFAQAANDAMPALLPVIEEIGRSFADLITAMAPLGPLFVDILKAILPVLPPLIDMVAEIMPELIDLVRAVLPLIQAFADAFVVALPILTGIVNFLLNVFVPVFTVIINVLSSVISAVVNFASGFWDIITTVFTSIGNAIRAAWNGIGAFFSQILPSLLGKVRDWITGVLRAIGQWGIDLFGRAKQIMSNFVGAIGTGIGNVVQWFKDLPGKVFSAIGNFIGRLVQLGKDLINGLIEGIKSAVKGVINAVTGVISDALNAAKSMLGIASPSKVFFGFGVDTVQGLINGIDALTPKAADAAANMAAAVADAGSNIALDPSLAFDASATGAAAVAASGGSAGAGNIALYQTNVMQPGADVNQFATEVYRNGARTLAAAGSTLGTSPQSVQAGMAGPGFMTGVRA
jgi:phage-related protein